MAAYTDQNTIGSDVANLSSRAQPVEAHFYHLPVGGDELVASLTVEIDEELYAVASELCFHGQPEPADRDMILRTAHNILAKRYGDSGDTTPMAVFRRDNQYPVSPIVHEEGGAVFRPEPSLPLWVVVAATIAAFFLLFFAAQIDDLFERPRSRSTGSGRLQRRVRSQPRRRSSNRRRLRPDQRPRRPTPTGCPPAAMPTAAWP